MGIPIVERCCGVANLRFGSAAIAILFATLALHHALTNTVVIMGDLSNPELQISPTLRAEFRKTVFQTAMATVALIMNIMLLIGIAFERMACIFPWIVLQTAATIFCGVMFFGYSIYTTFINFQMGLLVFLVSSLFTVIHGYFVVVVYSFYKRISSSFQHTKVPLSGV